MENGGVNEVFIGQIFASDSAAEQVPMILWSLDTWRATADIVETGKK